MALREELDLTDWCDSSILQEICCTRQQVLLYCLGGGKHFKCYVPGDNRWYSLAAPTRCNVTPGDCRCVKLLSVAGQVYAALESSLSTEISPQVLLSLERYDIEMNEWCASALPSTRAASDADRVRGKALCMRAIWRRTIRFDVRHLVACRELSGGAIPIRGQRQHRYTPVQPRRRHTADDTSRQWFADAATDRAAQSVQHRRQLHHQTALSRTIAVDKSCPRSVPHNTRHKI